MCGKPACVECALRYAAQYRRIYSRMRPATLGVDGTLVGTRFILSWVLSKHFIGEIS